VILPLDHAAIDASPVIKVVLHHAIVGGDWLTWIVSVDVVLQVGKYLCRYKVRMATTQNQMPTVFYGGGSDYFEYS
jgi:hypothetical protein